MANAWETRFNNHTLWSTVVQITETLNGIEAPVDPDAAADLRRLRLIVETLAQHRKEGPLRYTNGMLDRVYSTLSPSIPTWLEQYRTDAVANAASLRSASDGAEPVLEQMATLPSLTPKGAAIAAGKAAKTYQAASQAALARMRDDVTKFQAAVSGLDEKVAAIAEETADGLEKQASDVVDQILREQESLWKASLSAVDVALEDAQTEVVEIQKLHAESGRIASAVARKAVAHSYQKNALNKALGGWFWDIVGTIIGSIALGALLYHLLTATGETSMPLATTRLAVSIGGLGLAALCFRRGSGNHSESRRAKRVDIRLSTVNAFVANLDPDVQAVVIEGMAERIYIDGELDVVQEKDGSLRQTLEDRVTKYRERKAKEKAANDEVDVTP